MVDDWKPGDRKQRFGQVQAQWAKPSTCKNKNDKKSAFFEEKTVNFELNYFKYDV